MSSFQGRRSMDEHEAASIVAGMHSSSSKNTTGEDVPKKVRAARKKRIRSTSESNNESKRASASAKKKSPPIATTAASAAKKTKKEVATKLPPEPEEEMDETAKVFLAPTLKPAPYFYYSDHSLEGDDDPLTPIIAAGSVPTFPAKMHAILTNPDLAGVVAWAPHGRSWRILRPRDFEIRILPKYFEHSKFSSFVRQANGWGFRRLMADGGRLDKNEYYHEYFLRAMPWLCKKMRRPKVNEKKAMDSKMDPDLYAISRERPVPDRPPTSEVLVLQKTIERGPKARMPVLWDVSTPPDMPSSPIAGIGVENAIENAIVAESLSLLNHSASYGDLKQPAALDDRKPPANDPTPAPLQVPVPQIPAPQVAGAAPINAALDNGQLPAAQNSMLNNSYPQNTMASSNQNQMSAALNYAAAAAAAPPQSNPPPSNVASQEIPSSGDFAAGFMAATAYHSNQIQNMLGNAFLAGMAPPPQATPAAPTSANLINALAVLQRAGVGQQQVAQQSMSNHDIIGNPQANPNPPMAVAVAAAQDNNNLAGQSNTLNEQELMQRLLQFQAYQAAFGNAPQFPPP